MIPGRTEIVRCPYCWKKKRLLAIESGNAIDAEFWSDGKMIAPMLPKVSPVQKCQRCGKYYLEYRCFSRSGLGKSWEKGEMTYYEWKEAYSQFLSEKGVAKGKNRLVQAYNDFSSIKCNPEDLVNIRYWLIQSYNDCYYRHDSQYIGHETKELDPEEESFIAGIINEFIELYDWSERSDSLLKAELYREAGDMQKSSEVLSQINPEELENGELKVYCGIKERIKAGDKRVFKIG